MPDNVIPSPAALAILALSILPGFAALAHGVPQEDLLALERGGNLAYVWLGAKHMLTGYDHLLFIGALSAMVVLLAVWRRRESFATFSLAANKGLIAAGALLFLMQVHGSRTRSIPTILASATICTPMRMRTSLRRGSARAIRIHWTSDRRNSCIG